MFPAYLIKDKISFTEILITNFEWSFLCDLNNFSLKLTALFKQK